MKIAVDLTLDGLVRALELRGNRRRKEGRRRDGSEASTHASSAPKPGTGRKPEGRR